MAKCPFWPLKALSSDVFAHKRDVLMQMGRAPGDKACYKILELVVESLPFQGGTRVTIGGPGAKTP